MTTSTFSRSDIAANNFSSTPDLIAWLRYD
jgi:hypothetical protein